MLNRYPLWKNLIVLVVVTLGGIFALPNLYLPDAALQISAESSDGIVPKRVFERILRVLDEGNVPYFGEELEDGSAFIRFEQDATRLHARDLVESSLSALPERYIVALNLAPTTPQWLQDIGAEPMKYGLDLRGGVHFLMEVDTDKTVAERLKGLETEIKAKLREEKLRYVRLESVGDGMLRVHFKNDTLRNEARRALESQYVEFTFTGSDLDDTFSVDLTITENAIREMQDFAVKQNVQTIRKRVNELGVSEPLVQQLGRSRIVVDLPGVQDPAQAKKILGKVATLEFRLEAKPNERRSQTVEYEYEGRTARLEKKIILKGDRVVDSQPGFDVETSMPQVNITLDGLGGELMHRATRDEIGRRMAVIFIETKTRTKVNMVDGERVETEERWVDKRVISLATIQAALPRQFRITGLEAGEARELSLLLRAGALAADMVIAEERTVGASLGEENIRLGAISVVVGLGFVIVFMVAYYRVFGLAANVALAANLMLLVAVMSTISATLTLPGIAGIVLTVGMAVDANVLIFSRIKEELANGVTPQTAINAGFDRAFVTILDANLTTLLVAVVLYAIGTGAVKGFAVTLSIGILTSMFTAIMGTRAIINLIYGGRTLKTLAI